MYPHLVLALLNLANNQTLRLQIGNDVNLRPECIQEAGKAEGSDEHQEHELTDHGPQGQYHQVVL